ncbi:MAG: recombinase family protein [Tabrizicola sp.]
MPDPKRHESKRPEIKRCALYTRKSSDEGLDQEFNSLDAQRDACSAYVKSQSGEGWQLLPAPYDDGGYSGATMERPALRRLLVDIEAGRIDIIVVYKIDRLTRALADFARMVEIFDRHGVSFVSVTQAFNTTTSMGRLTLNVLLSFAQFEREVTGERIRDKIAASKAKGMWMGGVLPIGYYRPTGGSRTLVANDNEAALVRRIFARYLDLGSVHSLEHELRSGGVVSKRHTSRTGRVTGGQPFSRGALFHLLRNRLYLGEIRHRDTHHPGLHQRSSTATSSTPSRRGSTAMPASVAPRGRASRVPP